MVLVSTEAASFVKFGAQISVGNFFVNSDGHRLYMNVLCFSVTGFSAFERHT